MECEAAGFARVGSPAAVGRFFAHPVDVLPRPAEQATQDLFVVLAEVRADGADGQRSAAVQWDAAGKGNHSLLALHLHRLTLDHLAGAELSVDGDCAGHVGTSCLNSYEYVVS